MAKGKKFIRAIKEMITSPHVQIALATGISIIVLACVSKRILPEPMGSLPSAIPPFLLVIYEAASNRHKDSRIRTVWYWVTAIVAATGLVIFFYIV